MHLKSNYIFSVMLKLLLIYLLVKIMINLYLYMLHKIFK